MAQSPRPATPLQILKKYWGYDSFRPLQQDIVESVLAGHDTLALLPTGGGKSISFQVPGLMLGGLTLVVTPLISLMKDQVDRLRSQRIKAVYFHSAMSSYERRMAWERLYNGRCNFLYVSPERLGVKSFVEELRRLDVRLLVADEAHCISQWGYDFRPQYLRLGEIRKALPDAPMLALTASATPKVASDICEKLRFRPGHACFRSSFARQNISFIARPTEDKMGELLKILRGTSGSAIVYVRSRKRTHELADALTPHGISALNYHAGLSFESKEQRQNIWIEGGVRVMVATNAFGMGIDKADVRVVIHYDPPSSLEEYYQEAGRAGRDGLPSYAVILVSSRDKVTLKRRLTEAFPDKEAVKKVYERTCNFLSIELGEGYDSLYVFDEDKFLQTFGYQSRSVRAAFRILANAGYLEFVEETDTRAKAMIIVERGELYNLYGLSDDAERTINVLLRTYPGLFAEFVAINESQMANVLGISLQRVYDALNELRRQQVIAYVPQRRTPFIYLPTSREEPRYLVIGREAYEERRSRMEERISSMLEYMYGSRSCRVRGMLAYFGETDADDCGKCDVCRSRRPRTDNGEKARLSREILDWLRANPDGITREFFAARYGSCMAQAYDALGVLTDGGFARFDAERECFVPV